MLDWIVAVYGNSVLQESEGYLPYIGIWLGYATACAVLFARSRRHEVEPKGKGGLSAYMWLLPGFMIAAATVFGQSEIRHELDRIEEKQKYEFKNTAPNVNIRLGNSTRNGETLLEIQAMNMVPFKARWSVSATGQERNKNELLSGFMTGWEEFVPTDQTKRWLYPVRINRNKLHSGQIRLVFSYESEFYRELNRPGHLKGQIVQRYGYDEHGVTLPRTVPSERTNSR